MNLVRALISFASALALLAGCATSPFDSPSIFLRATKSADANVVPATRDAARVSTPGNVQFTDDAWLGGRPMPLDAIAAAGGKRTSLGSAIPLADILPLVQVGPVSFNYASVTDVLGFLLHGTGISLVVRGDAGLEPLQRPQSVRVLNLSGSLHEVVTTLAAQMHFAFVYSAQTKVIVVSVDTQPAPPQGGESQGSPSPAPAHGERMRAKSPVETAALAVPLPKVETPK